MLDVTQAAIVPFAAAPATPEFAPSRRAPRERRGNHDVGAALRLVGESLAFQRRVVRAGDLVYRAGEGFHSLYLLNAGICKLVNLAADGRAQVVSLKFRGDWMGFDGIAGDIYDCDAIAMDTGEVWIVRYDAILAALTRTPALLGSLHAAMSRAIVGDRDSLMSICTLPADARVADFLRYWAESLADRGMRYDQISLLMTRAEIGNYLGLTLETVSRSLSKLARANLIAFNERGRREISIPDLVALESFVQESTVAAAALH